MGLCERSLLLHNGFLHPPVLFLHLSQTPVANSSLRETEEPLIGFEGIANRIDRGLENRPATRHQSRHDYKYSIVAHLLRGGKTWRFTVCNLSSAHCVCDWDWCLGQTGSRESSTGRGLGRLLVFHNSCSLSGHVPILLSFVVRVTTATVEQMAHTKQ